MDVAAILKSIGGDAVTSPATSTVAEVVALLRGKGIGALVVSQDGVAIDGIVSERDILRGLAEHGAGALAMPVKDVMTNEVVTCGPDENIRELMMVMTAHRFRHIPVVENGALCGIISIGDLVKHRLEETEREAQAMRDYITAG